MPIIGPYGHASRGPPGDLRVLSSIVVVVAASERHAQHLGMRAPKITIAPASRAICAIRATHVGIVRKTTKEGRKRVDQPDHRDALSPHNLGTLVTPTRLSSQCGRDPEGTHLLWTA
jgi:hypothetical protein